MKTILKSKAFRRLIVVCMLTALVLSTMGTSIIAASAPVELNVSAAISLQDVLQKLAPSFEKKQKCKLVFNFGSSGELQKQIEQGAKADVFISAGKKQVDALQDKKLLLKNTRANIVGNTLVVIIPKSSKLKIKSLSDISKSKSIKKIAIGDPASVPAGQYAKDTLTKAKIWDSLQSKMVLGTNVRQVLTYVESGNADIGFVYLSDTKISSKVKVAYKVPSSYHTPIIYPAAATTQSKNLALSKHFIKYLKSYSADVQFKKYGFKPLD
jgi:molybdate transport system substrate-binding protein